MLQKYQTFHINGDQVVTAMLPSGRYVAFLLKDDEVRGYGHNRSIAIDDLFEKLDSPEPPDPPGWEGGFADNH